MWGALLNGARLEIVPRDVTLSSRDLAQRSRRAQHQRHVLDDGAVPADRARRSRRAFAPLRCLLDRRRSAGPRARQRRPERRKAATLPATCTGRPKRRRSHCLMRCASAADGAVPIGRPISNTHGVRAGRRPATCCPSARAGNCIWAARDSRWDISVIAGADVRSSFVPPIPFDGRAARASLCDGRRRALSRRRQPRISRPPRPASEDPRVPRRNRRSRSRAAPASGSARRVRPRARGRAPARKSLIAYVVTRSPAPPRTRRSGGDFLAHTCRSTCCRAPSSRCRLCR